MARTFIRQDTQIRKSDAYVDNIGDGQTNLETNAVNIEDDLNGLRSRVHRLLNNQGSNWYAALNVPTALDTGTARGVNNLNTDLHDLERKRVLVEAHHMEGVHVGTQATGTLTLASPFTFSDGETVTVGTQTYTLKSPFVNAANNIDASGTGAQTLENLRRAINGDGVAGTNYGTGTTVNTSAWATDTATTLVVTAIQGGTAGNSIATTATTANATFGGATLSGGVATNVSVFTRTAELPGNTTLAIGVVTTLGSVVAAHGGTFGNHALSAVSGASATSPKNLWDIVDASTHDPILSSGRRVYALAQSESVTDGSTVTITTPTRMQLSYVRLTSTGMALEAVPAADISGMTIHYTATERKALEDLNEQDFLRGSSLDVAAATTVTRQVAYDNQGTLPVELINNATLDIGTGLAWTIRDVLNADLLSITEGSTGGTSTVQLATDVDTFDVNAVVNDFNSGVSVATGGARINVGTTVIANTATIESVGATTDLRLLGSRELFLDDANQSGSTWAQTNGIKLSDTTAEWDLFETNFGEVSLLNAINQAKNTSARMAKVYANVTSTTTANNNVSLADANIDAALPDMSLGNFLTDYDVYLNGNLLRPDASVTGANNHDYYPGTALTPAAQLKFEFTVKTGDVLCVIPYA